MQASSRHCHPVEPNQPVDPAKDKRIAQVFYAVMASPPDNSIWGTLRTNPGSVARIDPGSNPPATALTEVYNVPMPGLDCGPAAGIGCPGCRKAARE